MKYMLSFFTKRVQCLQLFIVLIAATSIFVACKKKEYNPEDTEPIVKITDTYKVIKTEIGSETISNMTVKGMMVMKSAYHSDGIKSDEIWGTITAFVYNERTKYKSTPTVLFEKTEATRLILPKTGERNSNLATGDVYAMRLMYAPEDLDNTYLVLQIDLYNGRFYSNIGAEKHSGVVIAPVNKEYRFKFTDIIAKTYNDYGNITIEGVTFNNPSHVINIELVTPEVEYTPIWCAKKSLGLCTHYAKYNLTKESSHFKCNFAMHLE